MSTTIERPSYSSKIPEPFAEEASAVELGRLSVGGRDRLSAENFAVSVVQFVVDAREGRNQGALIDAIASPRLSQEARDEIVADYDGQRGLQTHRHYVTDGEAWMRSGIKGKAKAPREVQVEVGGVMENNVKEKVFVGVVRVDVARRAGRWEVVRVVGPAMRVALPSVIDPVKPFLEGRHWRLLPSVAKDHPHPPTKNSPDQASGKTPAAKKAGAKKKGRQEAGRQKTGRQEAGAAQAAYDPQQLTPSSRGPPAVVVLREPTIRSEARVKMGRRSARWAEPPTWWSSATSAGRGRTGAPRKPSAASPTLRSVGVRTTMAP